MERQEDAEEVLLLDGEVLLMDEQSLIGKKIGNYRITVEINSGAFGSVYKAEHTYLKERVVAIKLLHTYMEALQERMQFAQEAQFLAMLEHPHVLSLLDFGFSEHRPYLITRYAAGGSLRDMLKQQTSISIEKAISILTQIGQALHHAHQQNIIHRDLKPANVLFNAQGEALLADFGIATMLSTASIKQLATIGGTPQYMAPEQFRGLVSKEGDQYALGCIAYELMSGHLPFSAPDFLSMGFKHLSEKPIPPTRYNPHIPAETEAAILKAMAKQRHERHATLPIFLTALMAPFTQTPARKAVPTMPPGTPVAQALNISHTFTQSSMHKISPLAPGRPLAEQSPPSPVHPPQTSLRKVTPSTLSFTSPSLPASPPPARTQPRDFPGPTVPRETTHASEAAAAKARVTPSQPSHNAYLNQSTPDPTSRRPQVTRKTDQQTVRSNSDEALAQYHRGVSLSTLNRYEEALEAFAQAMRLDPHHALTHLNRGIALNALNRYAEAISAYNETIRLDPQHALAYYNLGVLLHDQGHYKEAISAFEQAIRLDPAYDSAYYGKGAALEQSGRRKEAKQAYKKAEQLRGYR